jgi:class 3 adenylate cyclase/predicted ATPase/ribosomal protein L40E
MRCPSCSQDNPGDASFCERCGAKLELICPVCKASVSPGAQFCRKCGTAIGATKAAVSTTVSSPKSQVIVAADGAASEAIEGERKTVTALFADIKGSTELMRDLDPEEARAIVDPALKLMIDAAHSYDGYVVQSTGDGIFALFGAPLAHEDHPQRALHAALAMQQELRNYAQRLAAQADHRLKPVPLGVRIGINTGEVVLRMVHTGGHTEYTPVGHAVNLAARMQGAAPAGGIVISEDTRHLVEGYFELRDLGRTEVKGISEPINVYEVVGAGPARGHFELAVRRGLTKFVGREREVAEMKRALELARAGHGQIVAAVAEAGTGKSRLVYEFKAMLPGDCKVLEAYSVSHGKASAYLPVLELLYRYFGIEDADDKAARQARIKTRINALDPALNDTLPLLYTLMGLHEGADPHAQMDPQIKRRRMLDAIKRIILRESLNQATVVIFEDLHWIDGETQALLDLLADGIANARVLLLVNYRPEYSHAWTNKSYYTQLRLDALGRESAGEMLSTLLGDGVELDPVKRMVIERTEGNPFFIEEMVRALFDEGALVRNGAVKVARPLSQLRLPPTVQGILAARIDRLPAEPKDLWQTLSVMGKESPLDLIRRVTSTAGAQLERMLSDLQAGEFIYEQPSLAGFEYAFKHALTQEVAYNSLLIERRKLLHERAASSMESLYAERLDDHLNELAHHYELSDNTRKALEYLKRAAEQAVGRSAHMEAVGLFRSALELLRAVPETLERDQEELELQLGLGVPLHDIKGTSAPEMRETYARARELCRQMGETLQLFPVLVGLWGFYNLRAELGTSRQLAQQLLSSAEDRQDPDLLLIAHDTLGENMYSGGEFVPARTHLERASALYDPFRHRSLGSLYWMDRGVNSLAYAGRTLWVLGYPDQAVDRVERALALARELSHPFSLDLALVLSSSIHALRGQGEAALECADEAVCLATERGFQFLAYGICVRGAALIVCGQAEEGVKQLREGLASMRAFGAQLVQTVYGAALADGCVALGRVGDGFAAVTEALAAAERTGERDVDAELHRLKGVLTLARGAVPSAEVGAEAEKCFRRAIEIARRQEAKSWELRATMSLARLLAKQGHRDEARAMLADIYNWFTEGFDTADLIDAKALLDELGN